MISIISWNTGICMFILGSQCKIYFSPWVLASHDWKHCHKGFISVRDGLIEGFSKGGSGTKSITWELVGNAYSQIPPTCSHPKSEVMWVGDSHGGIQIIRIHTYIWAPLIKSIKKLIKNIGEALEPKKNGKNNLELFLAIMRLVNFIYYLI